MKKSEFSSDYLFGLITETLDKKGCPICNLTKEATYDYIDSLFYENVNDPVERAAFEKSHGYCPRHLQMVEDHIKLHPELGILGVTVLYHDLFNYLEDVFDEELKIGDGCPLCKMEEDAEKRYIDLFANYISDGKRLEEYEKSISIVCNEHSLVLKSRKNFDSSAFLKIQREKIAQLKKDFEEFIRKNDYIYSGEKITQREGQAWMRLSEFLKSNDTV